MAAASQSNSALAGPAPVIIEQKPNRLPDKPIGGAWASLTLHAVCLLLVLTALAAFVTTDAVWTSDEGALLYQAQSVASGQGWEVPHPFPEADPAGVQYPIELSVHGVDGGYLPYSRHAPLVWIVGHIYLLFGYLGVIMLSVFGTVGAAIAAAKLGLAIDTNPTTRARTGTIALWCTGVGSPMLFNSYIAWAHTLAAALLCWAFYLLSAPLRPQPGLEGPPAQRIQSRPSARFVVFGMVLIASACLLRSEAVLAGFAIGLALYGVHKVTKSKGLPVPAIAALTAAVGGLVADKSLNPQVGEPVKPATFDETYGLFDGRLAGIYQTWLRPTTDTGVVSLLFLLGALLLIASGFLARQYRTNDESLQDDKMNQSGGPSLFAAIGFGLVAIGAALLSYNGSGQLDLPSVLVPGLLVAFPSLFAGLLITGRTDLKQPLVLASLSACGLFWLAVIATQYRFGGGAEWGGRYFSATLPLAVPVAVVNLQNIFRRRASVAPILLVGALVATQVLFGFLGLSRIRTSRSELSYLDDKVAEAESLLAANPDPTDAKPVFVTTVPPAGRWMWQHLDHGRWLWAEPQELSETIDRLADLGVLQVALVSLDQDNDLAKTAGRYKPQAEADLSEPVIILDAISGS